MTYRLIADGSGLEEAAHYLKDQSRIALDCEAAGFHRYTDRLCLVQLTTPAETLLFDPLSADPRDALKEILEDPEIQVVMHGADFDLRLLHRDLGIRVRGLFDTQAAATLLGATSIGLASLLEEHLEVTLSKKHQRADWAKRPLAQELLEYAASDTQHLLPLCDVLIERLGAVGPGGLGTGRVPAPGDHRMGRRKDRSHHPDQGGKAPSTKRDHGVEGSHPMA